MTKCDVAVWFCKVVALGGMISTVFSFLSAVVGWRFFGANFLYSVPALGFYGFVWLFARGIGIEVAAEGEHGDPIASAAELRTLLLRCVGLTIFLWGALAFGSGLFNLAVSYFSSRTMPRYMTLYLPSIVGGFLQAVVGFLLAFGPRIRIALQPK